MHADFFNQEMSSASCVFILDDDDDMILAHIGVTPFLFIKVEASQWKNGVVCGGGSDAGDL